MRGDALEDASRALSGSALRAEMREGRGRCLVAQRRIRKGEVVLEEDAFAAVLYPNKVSDYCDYEMTMGSGKLLRCSKTRVARYSSKQAQASASALIEGKGAGHHAKGKGSGHHAQHASMIAEEIGTWLDDRQ